MAFEGSIKMHTGEEVQISDQQLVSCDSSNGGCNGGWMANAWSYQGANGAVSAADYPYTSGATFDSGACAIPEDAQRINYNPSYRYVVY